MSDSYPGSIPTKVYLTVSDADQLSAYADKLRTSISGAVSALLREERHRRAVEMQERLIEKDKGRTK